MSTSYFQFNEKQYNFTFYFHVIFNTKQLKFNLKLTNLCRFDEWQLSATIHLALVLQFSASPMERCFRTAGARGDSQYERGGDAHRLA